MPTAGDEGYEKLIICPYDRAHEVRMGRMQFHLDKCRKNFPEKAKEMIQCPFNSTHLIRRVEEQFHTEEECTSRANWDRFNYEVGDTYCPVKDLVPVNAVTVPDGDENWDDFEAKGSVLAIIKNQAQDKDILRFMQCESKAKRKNFRIAERLRHDEIERAKKLGQSFSAYEEERTRDTKTKDEAPLPLPTKKFTGLQPLLQQQDPASALQKLNLLDNQLSNTKMKKSDENSQSSAFSKYQPEDFPSLPGSSGYAASASSRSLSSRPSTAMSIALSSASGSRPQSEMANISNNDVSTYKRVITKPVSEDKFCQVPIPGLGRGSRRVQKS